MNRKQLAETIEGYDAEISALQLSKRETYDSYRIDLAKAGYDKDGVKAELEAFKLALRRKLAVKKSSDEAVTAQVALVDEIFAEITAARAPRATRVASDVPKQAANVTRAAALSALAELDADIIEHDAETGEIKPDMGNPISTSSGPAAPEVRDMLVSATRLPGAGPETPYGDTNSHTSAYVPDRDNGASGETSSAGTEGEVDRQPIQEPLVLATTDALSSGAATRKDAVTAAPEADHSKPNPWCLDPEECGLSSWEHFCLKCQRVKAERQAEGVRVQ